MSVVISLFGIANSLFLSIHERTREFGLLRAVGATQRAGPADGPLRERDHRGHRRAARHGDRHAVRLPRHAALDDLGLGFALPVGQLAVFLVLAVVVGVIGAVVPARRGARLHVLEAMRSE